MMRCSQQSMICYEVGCLVGCEVENQHESMECCDFIEAQIVRNNHLQYVRVSKEVLAILGDFCNKPRIARYNDPDTVGVHANQSFGKI